MNIRPETPHDYAAIATINARAFSNRPDEALIVALHRHRADFDPDLSLVMESDGQIIGHVLFSPQTIRLMDENVRAVNLAPIAVDPLYQRQGIGGNLIAEGHRVAIEKGYQLSYLLGHSAYYPRFGYKTGAYGNASVTVDTATLGKVGTLETRVPTPDDVAGLHALWEYEEGAVDFSVDPGRGFLDWVNANPAVQTRVYLDGVEVVGYTRIETHDMDKPRMFLAKSPEYARMIAVNVADHVPDSNVVTLPLHPYSKSASAFEKGTCTAWDAGMAMTLTESPFDDYYALVKAGERLPGRPVWPVAFEMEGILS
ncbi:MAG: N-acetyltransferase [Aggregatilineales bacterium]